MNGNNLYHPRATRNIDDHLGVYLDRIIDNEFDPDRDKSIDELLLPFSTLPVRRVRKRRAGR